MTQYIIFYLLLCDKIEYNNKYTNVHSTVFFLLIVLYFNFIDYNIVLFGEDFYTKL